MFSAFTECTFNELIQIQRGHDLPNSKRIDGGVPVAGSSGVVGYHNESKGLTPGITIGRSGSIGYVNFYIKPYFPLNTVLYVTDFKGNDPKFVFYFLKNFDFTNYNSGSVQPSLNRNFLNPAVLNVPSVGEQKVIAYLLGTLDDKIELNQKMNQTLEEIAKAIFKSWFVDFDPVRAKAEGRHTGLPPEISDLFPDELVESEIGEMPKGWQNGTLSRFLKIQGGFAFKSRDFGEVGFKVVKIKNINSNGTVNLENCDRVKVSDKKLDRFVLFDGNVIIAMTGATVGKVGLISVRSSKIYLNQRVGRVVPKIEKNGNCWFSYLSLSSNFVKEAVELLAYGSAQPNISSKYIEGINYINPPEEIILEFNKVCSPVFQKALLNIKESETLALLRDTLLPKLISGELRIPDAEKLLEEAGI